MSLDHCRQLAERFFRDVRDLPVEDGCSCAVPLVAVGEPSLADRTMGGDVIRITSYRAFHVVTVVRATGPSAQSAPKLSMFVAHASEPQMRQVMDIPLDGAAWRDLHHLASRSTIRGLPKSEVPEKTPGGRDGTSDCVETRIAGVHDVVRRDNIGSEASWRGTGDVVKVVRFMREFARTAQDIGRDGGVAATLSDADRVKHSNVAEDSQVQSDASLPLGDSVPGARFIRPTVEECRAALDDERPLRLTIGLPAPHIYDRFRGALHALAAARQPCIALCAVRHLTLGRKQKHDLAEFIGLHMDARGVVDKVEACDVSDGPFAACLAAELVGERLIGSANARERVVPFVFWPAEQPGPPDVTEKADAVPSDGNQIRDGG